MLLPVAGGRADSDSQFWKESNWKWHKIITDPTQQLDQVSS